MQTEAVTIKTHIVTQKDPSWGSRDLSILFNWGSGSSLILASFSIGIVAQSSVL